MFKKIEENLKRLLPREENEPLVIRRAICEELSGEVISLGEGRKIFPYNQVVIQLYAPDDKQQLIYEAAFVRGNHLIEFIRECLRREGCQVSETLPFKIIIVRERSAEWDKGNYKIIYTRDDELDNSHESILGARLVVLSGKAKNKSYRIKKAKTYIGRLEEVVDKHGFTVQRNDVVFLDLDDELNSTVSRMHACIEFDDRNRDFFLRDSDSRHGTRIERKGQMIEVSGPLGVRLQDGDKLYFGRTSAHFSIDT